jgi:ribonuclease HII
VFGVGVADVAEIDSLNILRATHLAMARALKALSPLPDFVLVDGLPVPGLPCPSRAIVGGDGRSLSIAAASIIAKVTRDRMMVELDGLYPGYQFARHKGYGTQIHMESLFKLGPCPAHRRSFRPVQEALRVWAGGERK